MGMFGSFKRKKKEKKVGVAAGTTTAAELKKSYGKKKKKKPTLEVNHNTLEESRDRVRKKLSNKSKPRCKRTSSKKQYRPSNRGDGPDLIDALVATEIADELFDDDDYTPGPVQSTPVESYNSGGYESDSSSCDSGSSDCGGSDDF